MTLQEYFDLVIEAYNPPSLMEKDQEFRNLALLGRHIFWAAGACIAFQTYPDHLEVQAVADRFLSKERASKILRDHGVALRNQCHKTLESRILHSWIGTMARDISMEHAMNESMALCHKYVKYWEECGTPPTKRNG